MEERRRWRGTGCTLDVGFVVGSTWKVRVLGAGVAQDNAAIVEVRIGFG